jgi:hypothetical protein
LAELRLQRAGAGAEQCKEERAGDVGGEDDGPQAKRGEEVTAFGENQRNGVERVLGEELAAPEDDGHESQRIEEVGGEERGRSVAESSRNRRYSQGGESHGEAADEAGEREGLVGTRQLSFGDARDLLVDLHRGGTVEILLDGLRGIGFGEFLKRAHGLSGWMRDPRGACYCLSQTPCCGEFRFHAPVLRSKRCVPAVPRLHHS